jgi:hypothetical protein
VKSFSLPDGTAFRNATLACISIVVELRFLIDFDFITFPVDSRTHALVVSQSTYVNPGVGANNRVLRLNRLGHQRHCVVYSLEKGSPIFMGFSILFTTSTG